jgi:DNA-binding LacI/PurR family transcriptional regulator
VSTTARNGYRSPVVRPQQDDGAARPRAVVTSADVAREAGVSRAAVSQILNGRGQRFSVATRERVEQVARSLAYQPSAAGRMLVSGTSDLVVAVVPNTTFGAHLQDIVDVLTRELATAGLTLVLRFSTSGDESFDRLIAGMRPAAVLPLGPLSDEEREVLAARRVPVAMGSPPKGSREAGHGVVGALQADHLVERGYRRLGYAQLKDARDDPYGRGRLRGFRDRCLDLGCTDPAVMALGVDVDDALGQLERIGRGIAVAAYNDDVALTLLAAARRLGWEVPEDLAVIGMDDLPLARIFSPRPTTIGYDPSAIGRRLAHAVLATLTAGRRPAVKVEYAVIQGETT